MGLEGQDELVLVADSHAPNNMIAFWRDEIPADWAGLPGYDRRVAAVTPLPYSTHEGEGFTAENSPTAWGYDIAIAQYNGFSPGPNPVPGVQKLTWNPEARTLDVVWATDAVNFNNVMTYSIGSNLVYGTGRRDGVYHFWGLDWNTGDIALEVPLGDSDDYLDQGNQVTIAEDQTILYGSATGIVRLRPSSLSSLDEGDNSWLVSATDEPFMGLADQSTTTDVSDLGHGTSLISDQDLAFSQAQAPVDSFTGISTATSDTYALLPEVENIGSCGCLATSNG
jgi:hypothetical protein